MSLLEFRKKSPRTSREFSTWLGMVVFLGIMTMWFGALFFSYAVLRADAVSWPPEGVPRLPLGMPGLNTGILFLSSLTLATGLRRLRTGRPALFPRWLLATLVLGIAFLALQLHVWIDLWKAGLTFNPEVDVRGYVSVFYGLTVVHAIHIVAGLIALLVVAIPALRGQNLTARYGTVRLATMFWHFIGAVWVLMFVTVYVL